MNQQERRDQEMAYISDEAVMEEQRKCRKILQKLNFMDRSDFEGLKDVVAELLPGAEGAFINPPFYCDYGTHIKAGKGLYVNYNCTILDVATVTFGENCLLAPNVAIYTAGHPVYPGTRNSAYEYGKAITIGNNVWIGGNTVICPGVTIGDDTVIGAGSVVTKDLPARCIAAGNPCRVIRDITEEDRKRLFRDEMIDEEAWQDITERGFAD